MISVTQNAVKYNVFVWFMYRMLKFLNNTTNYLCTLFEPYLAHFITERVEFTHIKAVR